MTTNIYILIDPRNGEVRYIGQAKVPGLRYRQHCTSPEHRGQLSAVWLRRLVVLGLQPQLRVLERAVPVAEAHARECYWITYYRDREHDVLNQVGPGCQYVPSDERIGLLLTENVSMGEFVGQRPLVRLVARQPAPPGAGRAGGGDESARLVLRRGRHEHGGASRAAGCRHYGGGSGSHAALPLPLHSGGCVDVSARRVRPGAGLAAYTSLHRVHGRPYPDLIAAIRARLVAWGGPWIIENVVGAPLQNAVLLCGAMFGLRVYRHRLFESNHLLLVPPHRPHRDQTPTAGHGGISPKGFISIAGHFSNVPYGRVAMGIPWMTQTELAQAIPPAYSRFLVAQLAPLGPGVAA